MFNPTLSLRKLAGAAILACVAASASQASPRSFSPGRVREARRRGPRGDFREDGRPGPGYPDVIERVLRSKLQQAKKLKRRGAQAKAGEPSRQFDDWFRDPPRPICSTDSTVDDWFRDRACGRG